MLNWISFFGILFLNSWIYRIFQTNILVFFGVLITSIFFYASLNNKKVIFKICVVMGLLILVIFQIQTTEIRSLTELTNDEQRVQTIRMKSYQSEVHLIRLLFYRVNLIDFFEKDFGVFGFRIQKNFFETIDPNIYFFAGHPRERIEGSDFPKFPFVYIFLFLIGGYSLIKRKNFFILSYLIIILILFSYIGHKNSLGPFLLLPFFVITISLGINRLLFKK